MRGMLDEFAAKYQSVREASSKQLEGIAVKERI
jgi:hypothetical protein